MTGQLYFERLRGKRLPQALLDINWEGTGQQIGKDPLGNVWIRNNPDEMYLSVDSDYRTFTYMTLALFISNGVVEDFDWYATLASQVRPSSVAPQTGEANQVARLIRPLFHPRRRVSKAKYKTLEEKRKEREKYAKEKEEKLTLEKEKLKRLLERDWRSRWKTFGIKRGKTLPKFLTRKGLRESVREIERILDDNKKSAGVTLDPGAGSSMMAWDFD